MSEGPALQVVDAASGPARWAIQRYYEDLELRFDEVFDVEEALVDAVTDFNPPRGHFVVAESPTDPLACGAVRFLDEERGEIKRMWVSPPARGQGLATRLLVRLEELVRESGRHVVVLDTNAALTEAIALYEARGYERIARYNDNPHAHHWFRKELAP